MKKLNNLWGELLESEFKSEYFLKLEEFLKNEYSQTKVFPKKENIFKSLEVTDYNDVKVVVIGQDPYHNENQSHGLAFSVQNGTKPPPSLINIFKEQENDLQITQPRTNGNLTPWAKQGVLLLNTVLTVRENEPYSHKSKGWEKLTDKIISLLNEKETPIVFLLWGANAIKKSKLITNPNHLVLTSVHPSPLSAFRGFFGCKHFSKTNEFLIQTNQTPINWQL